MKNDDCFSNIFVVFSLGCEGNYESLRFLQKFILVVKGNARFVKNVSEIDLDEP